MRPRLSLGSALLMLTIVTGAWWSLALHVPPRALRATVTTPILKIAAGGGKSMVLDTNGQVYAWGNNQMRDLGVGASSSSVMTPMKVKGIGGTGYLSGITSLAIGGINLAINDARKVYAWGAGDPNLGTIAGSNPSFPALVAGEGGTGELSDIIAIATGSHKLALTSNGNVYAWGVNSHGQLGNGSLASASFPQKVKSADGAGILSGIVAIATGEQTSFAVGSDGKVYAWGYNVMYMLGDGTTVDRSLPIRVQGLSGIVAVDGGNYSTMALGNDGSVYAWGAFLPCGRTATQGDCPIPVRIPLPENIKAIDHGNGGFAAALGNSGRVYTWGYNPYGELGNGSTVDSNTPVSVLGVGGTSVLSGIAAISAAGHALALGTNGNLYAWGYNYHGELGDGTTQYKTFPLIVTEFNPASSSAAACIPSNCADTTVCTTDTCNASGVCVHSNNTVACSDSNACTTGDVCSGGSCQPGAALNCADTTVCTTDTCNTSTGCVHTNNTVACSDSDACTTGDVCSGGSCQPGAALNCNDSDACTTDTCSASTGCVHTSIIGCGSSSSPAAVSSIGGTMGSSAAASSIPPSSVDAQRLAASNGSTFFIASDGALYAWGQNGAAQLGIGSLGADVRTPMRVGGAPSMKAVSISAAFGAGVAQNGSVYVWGLDPFWTGSTTFVTSPQLVNGLPTVKAVAAGSFHTLVLAENGNVYAWGRNDAGQLGNGQTVKSTVPVQVPSLSNITAVAAAFDFSVALASNGNVYTWGSGVEGHLGLGNQANRLTPQLVPGLPVIKAISAGANSVLALDVDGFLHTWGRDVSHPGEGTFLLSPVLVTGLPTVQSMAMVASHATALTTVGTVYAWGYNEHGNLGNGTTQDSSTPMQVSGLTNIVAIGGSGGHHNLALGGNGSLYAWGLNVHGEIGDGTITDRLVPVVVNIVPSSAASSSSAAASSVPATDLLVVSQTGPASVSAGGVATYTVTVRNEGSATATNLVVTAAPPFQFTRHSSTTSTCSWDATKNVVRCSAVNLSAGQTRTYTFAYTAPPAAACPKAGGAHIVLTTTPTADPYRWNNRSIFETIVSACSGSPPVPSFPDAAGADLWVQMLGPTLPVAKGSVIAFPLLLRNVGFDTAQGVRLQNAVPAGLVYNVAGSPAECVLNAGGTTVTCSFSPLDPLSAVSLSLRFSAPADMSCDAFDNTATALTSTTDTDNSNNNDAFACTVQCAGASSAASSASSGGASSGGVSSIGGVTCNAASSHASGGTCTQFCPTGGSASPNAGCTDICSYFPANPGISSVLCTPPQNVLSFSCEVYPGTPALANYPRSYCTYVCGN